MHSIGVCKLIILSKIFFENEFNVKSWSKWQSLQLVHRHMRYLHFQ